MPLSDFRVFFSLDAKLNLPPFQGPLVGSRFGAAGSASPRSIRNASAAIAPHSKMAPARAHLALHRSRAGDPVPPDGTHREFRSFPSRRIRTTPSSGHCVVFWSSRKHKLLFAFGV